MKVVWIVIFVGLLALAQLAFARCSESEIQSKLYIIDSVMYSGEPREFVNEIVQKECCDLQRTCWEDNIEPFGSVKDVIDFCRNIEMLKC